MKTENKETELLSAIGKFTVRYLDYVFVFFTFPIIFDIKWTDPKLLIAIGALIVIRAIMPGAVYLTTPHKKLVAENLSPTSNDGKIIYPASKEVGADNEGIVFTSYVDNTTMQSSKIEFPGLGKITTRKAEDGEVVASFPDFRTVRLKKDEISQLYKALLESEVTFFQPGKWEIMIKVRKASNV